MLLYVGNWGMVHGDDHEVDGGRQILDLFLDPTGLVAAWQQRSIAVQRNQVNPRTQLRGIPTPVAHGRESVPPVLQVRLGVAMKLMIAKCWENLQVDIAPDFRLGAEYGVVVRDTASQRDIAIH